MVGGARKLPNQELFDRILSLQGRPVEVATHGGSKHLSGEIVNTMFDSFLLEDSDKNRHVIRFVDLFTLDEKES